MSETGTRKRAEELAVENVRRITEVMREERNNAVALAQIRREELEKAKKLLKEAVSALPAQSGDLVAKISEFLAKPTN
ncbi:MAG: hypothetical protein FJX59_01830 [Alphaproteobacteria bacterium]|nr:hypothetical protein [Alphaproteobacteria bacterium]